MNMEALQEITNNNIEILEFSARDNGDDENVIVAIARNALVVRYTNLSDKDKSHFDDCIRPLIEDVQCGGYSNEIERTFPDFVHFECTNTIPDHLLVEYYVTEGEAFCEGCEGEASDFEHSKAMALRD